MRYAVTLVVMFVVSFVIAALISPPDPLSCYIDAAAIFLVATLSYVVGLREGSIAPAALENPAGRNAVDTE